MCVRTRYWEQNGDAIKEKFMEKANEYIDTTKEFTVRAASGGGVILQQAGSAAAAGVEITSEFLTGTAAPAVAHVAKTHLLPILQSQYNKLHGTHPAVGTTLDGAAWVVEGIASLAGYTGEAEEERKSPSRYASVAARQTGVQHAKPTRAVPSVVSFPSLQSMSKSMKFSFRFQTFDVWIKNSSIL